MVHRQYNAVEVGDVGGYFQRLFNVLLSKLKIMLPTEIPLLSRNW